MPRHEGFRRTLSDPESTRRAGRVLAALLEPGDVLGLIGDLGAGKTFLVQAIAEGLEVPPGVRVTSPTFTLINEYLGGRLPLYHADLYRIGEEEELDELGLDDIVRGEGVVAIEWSDRFAVVPGDHVRVELAVEDDEARALTVTGSGARGRALAEAWSRAL